MERMKWRGGESERLAVCTIAAKNYISFAKVLCRSVAENNPEVEVFLLLVDDHDGYVDPAAESFEIVSIGDLAIPECDQLAFQYGIVEFATAVKPYFLEHLLEIGIGRVLYLDPDIMVASSLGPLFEQLNDAQFLVTPHTNIDYPDDDCIPDERLPMMHGVYNLGFFGLRSGKTAVDLLRWWQKKLRTKCIIDHKNGYFVDQKFMDLAFQFFPGFHIENHPGCNVAYWNLHAREISQEGSQWMCNGQPLVFYHFSSFRAQNPEILSPYCSRYQLTDREDVQALYKEYYRRLMAEDYETNHFWPYSHGFFEDGEAISSQLRELYFSARIRGRTLDDPFTSKPRMEGFLGLTKIPDTGMAKQNYWKVFAKELLPPFILKMFRKVSS